MQAKQTMDAEDVAKLVDEAHTVNVKRHYVCRDCEAQLGIGGELTQRCGDPEFHEHVAEAVTVELILENPQ